MHLSYIELGQSIFTLINFPSGKSEVLILVPKLR